MWKPVTKNGESLGLVATTVGELKEMLKYVPDNYALSVTGVSFGMLMETDEEMILMDEVGYLEDLLVEQEMCDKKEINHE